MAMHEGVYAFVGGPKYVHCSTPSNMLTLSAMKQEQNAVCFLCWEQIWLACPPYLRLLLRDIPVFGYSQ